ncbi:MAG: AzlC family ABC transporter permease [Erysipelotrichaceae bacterium]|nr:AzlC family ABC transporter permease [Erysipelotrichaceae bacterium]
MNSFRQGFRNAIPIGLGYFAVAFSLGIIAANAGISAFQGFLTSLLVNASAGENAAFIAIKENASYFEMIIIMIVSNIRYVLMSFALSQKIDPKASILHRLILGFFLTDEYFALEIAQDGYVDPLYMYGAIACASPCWAIGTALGIIMGNILPLPIVSALSVALYGMFMAIFVPACKRSRTISILVLISFLGSYFLSRTKLLSESIATIVLTIVIAGLGALIAPVEEEDA